MQDRLAIETKAKMAARFFFVAVGTSIFSWLWRHRVIFSWLRRHIAAERISYLNGASIKLILLNTPPLKLHIIGKLAPSPATPHTMRKLAASFGRAETRHVVYCFVGKSAIENRA